jgi:large conductance mechanosensitive channel
MIKEFKKFIFRGNVIDLAVGVVVGSAFTGIVNSLVNNVIMPFVGVLTAGVNFKDITIDLTPLAKALGVTDTSPEMPIGLFINSIVEFFIIAIAIFIIVKAINISRDKMEEISKKKGKKKEEENKQEEVSKPEDILLLQEIRDLLKKNKSKK